MSDEIGSGDILDSVVQDSSVSPEDLPSPSSMLHLNVDLSHDCPEFLQAVLRSSDTRVQCFKTTTLLGGKCGNLASPELIPLTCLSPQQQLRGKQLKCRWVLSPPVTGGRFRTGISERKGILHEKSLVIIRSSVFCAVLSIHDHLLELHCLRGSTTSRPLVQSMKPTLC